VRYNRALVLLRLERPDDAGLVLREAARLDPNDAEIARALATLAGPAR
jgi:Flp pilus assembly protein TadD